jgi:methyltransferase-like protein/cyclopropane fatty-acyl-phospholipid synthase-like methyltransferase
MAEANQTSYDEVPYMSQPFPQTHPDRLAVLARLFGVAPRASSKARVLELGCASGGNLIPMAAQMPDATFVGVDLSARQIADGNEAIGQLGLHNIELQHRDILAIDADLGRFDYIIAHGVYSWVPAEVQSKLLSICRTNLAPVGVAYVSYNVYPGWRMRGMVRDMMLYHSRPFTDPKMRVQQARALLDFLAENAAAQNDPYALLLKQEVEMLRKQNDSYLAHDHLEHVNEPIYFHEFAARAAEHGLQYLGEAEFKTMVVANFSPKVMETLRSIAPDILRMEQYMDFLRNRTFRQTLLTHKEAVLNRNLDWHTVEAFAIASPVRPSIEQTDVVSRSMQTFQVPAGGGTIRTAEPLVKAAMTILGDTWPRAIPFTELCAAARSRISQNGPASAASLEDRRMIGAEVLKCFAAGIVELYVDGPRFPVTAGERPRASALARHEATKGTRVTNLRHESVALDDFNRQLLQRLDGGRDRSELLAMLEQLVATDVLAVRQEGQPVRESTTVRRILDEALSQNLDKLARAALLEA